MNTASFEPATMRSSAEASASSKVGFTRKPPSSSYAMRTAEMGPSNGMPAAMSAAEAPMIEITSGWLIWSAESTVAMTWTSLRKPSEKAERSGRSIMRAVRTAFSLGRASRLMNPPGSLPAAYMRSSKSTVRGKKSRSLGCLEAVAATRTMLSPCRTTTAPPACLASSPVSSTYSLPYSSNVSTTLAIRFSSSATSSRTLRARLASHGPHPAGRSCGGGVQKRRLCGRILRSPPQLSPAAPSARRHFIQRGGRLRSRLVRANSVANL